VGDHVLTTWQSELMKRTMFGNCALIFLVATGLNLWPSCRGQGGEVSELPPPGTEQRPPGSPPELPRLSVEFPSGPMPVPVRVLSAGDDLQDALDDAKPGDVIALHPGAIFKGSFRLPKKPGSDWITIRTSVADGTFPPPGTRIDRSHARLMPIIESSSGPAITAAAGAHHYRFVGIEIRPRSGTFLHNLILLGSNETSVKSLPHHIVFERCYLHGDPKVGGRRGIALNSRHTAVVDSYLADFKEQGADSQALCGWNGLGPFAIVNNYLEGAGENLMFGGADPAVKNLVPSDILITRNHFAKPLSWKIGDPSYAGTPWTIKNLFELKNARRVLVEGNIFENNWLHAQVGFAILFTVRNENGTAPWSVVEDVTFTHNIVRHTASAVNILGKDGIHPSGSQQTKRILIRDNVFEDVDEAKWGGSGRLFQILSEAADVVIDHNTAFHSGDIITAEGKPNLGFVYTNNLTPHNLYGVGGTNTYGNPLMTLETYFPGALFAKNVLIGRKAGYTYPPDNFLPATLADVGFVDLPGRNYRLTSTSSYKKAGTDGKDIGADIDSLEAAMRTGAAPSRPVQQPPARTPTTR
jgi:hypothetical protein